MKSAKSLVGKGKAALKKWADETDGQEMGAGISKLTEWTKDYKNFLSEQVEVADIIEFARISGAYTHVGVYVGDGKVIDYSGDKNAPFGTATVRHRLLIDAAEGKVYIFIFVCTILLQFVSNNG